MAQSLQDKYGFDFAKQSHLFVVDFCLTNQMYIDLLSMFPELNIVVLDHHITSKNSAVELMKGDMSNLTFYFNMDYSGAVMSQVYAKYQINPNAQTERAFRQVLLDEKLELTEEEMNVPVVYQMIQDRDLWRFKLPTSHAYTTWFFNNVKTLEDVESKVEIIDGKEQELPNQHIEIGQAMVDMFNSQINMLMNPNNYKEVVIDVNGSFEKGYIINASPMFASDLGSQLCRVDDEHKFAIVWSMMYNNGEPLYKYSLRSTNDYDCSVIAKHFGGGGHKQACAFIANEFIF